MLRDGNSRVVLRIAPRPAERRLYPELDLQLPDDQIVADLAMFDLAALGAIGAVPGYPGAEECPPQPMLRQTRAVLDAYAENGGQYREIVIEDAGHSPYIEKPDEFNAHFHAFLREND